MEPIDQFVVNLSLSRMFELLSESSFVLNN